jgi:Ca-activated chloride channel homolog
MKSSVAFFLALTIFTSGSIRGQAPSRRANQGEVSKSRNDTLKICQGVPIPDGYVIIAYMTSAACPHGAYLLKKQNDYESSLGVNGSARQPSADSSAAASKTAVAPAKSASPGRRTSTQAARKSAAPTRTTSDPGTSTATQTGNAGVSSPVSRPRRVGNVGNSASTSVQSASPAQSVASSPGQVQTVALAQPQDTSQTPQGPPSLIGSQKTSATGPPTLGNVGLKPSSAAENNSSDTAAQTGPEEVGEGDVLKVETSLVTVPVSVLDRQGRFISNLKQDDFRIFENDVEQSIAYFEPAEKPFTVALLLDTSASTHFHLDDIREAAIAFAKQLRPQDRVLIVSFNDEVLLLTEATNDLNLVETVIDQANTGNSTRLYDAVDLTIKERLNKIKGRKAIVLFTDGVDTSSQQATYHTTLSEVDELDALIYPIQYDTSDYLNAMQGNGTVTVTTTSRGLFGIGSSTQTYNVPMNNGNNGIAIPGSSKADYDRADRYLHALADKTGGRLYQANDTKQLADAFSRIAEELRRQYSLGYYPKTEGADGRRQIRVKVKQSNLAVKARDSYTKAAPASPTK